MTTTLPRPAAPQRSVESSVAVADVCLVSMPWASLSRPSMALGLLKSLLVAQGISTTVAYPNFWFAEQIGIPRYLRCAGGVPTELLLGEWVFRQAAFGADPELDERFLDHITEQGGRWLPATPSGQAALRRQLLQTRDAADEFVTEAAERVVGGGARIVGCTSTFEQHVASLALLRRVRELRPDVVTMIGGANCETVMGEATHRNFKWVDFVVSGEADGLVGPLVARILETGRDIPLDELPRGVRGPAHRRALLNQAHLPRALYRNLDALPCPDFDEYFDTLEASACGQHIRPGLPLETSRGCWWGVKHQCTFCGLNGSSLTYDSKSPATVLAELHQLEERYRVRDFEVVDNILDSRFFTTLLPELEHDGGRARRIFFEVKANLNRGQIEQLVAAGVTWVQPGIESLSSNVLTLMDKGVQGWQNVQLLRWARELGLRMSWSILWGFPGESDEDYVTMAQWLPLLEHLQAPAATIRLRYDRYSVYYNEALERGLTLRPVPSIGYVYPLPVEELADLTYFFLADDAEGVGQSRNAELARRPGVQAVLVNANEWTQAFFGPTPPSLTMTDVDHRLTVRDTRRCARAAEATFTGVDREVLLAGDAGVKPARLRERLGATYSATEVDASVDRLRLAGLLLPIDGRLLTLAVHESDSVLPDVADFPGGSTALRAPSTAGPQRTYGSRTPVGDHHRKSEGQE